MRMDVSYKSALMGALVLPLLVGACAPMPKLGALVSPRAIVDVEQSENMAPDAAWWRSYGDGQLDDLMAVAFKDSPSLAQASAALHRAQSGTLAAGAAMLPNITANASVSKLKQSYNNGIDPAFVPQGYKDSGRATLDFSYELDFFGRNRNALKAAQGRLEAAKLEAAQARVIVASTLAGQYATLAQLYAELDAAQETLRLQEKTLSLFKDRQKSGLENASAVDEAMASLAAAKADVAALQENIALTRNALADIAGQSPDFGQRLAAPKLEKLTSYGAPEALPVDLIARRPDVMAARLQVEAAAKQIKVAKAGFYPNINLAAYWGHQSLGMGTFFERGSIVGSLGPAVHLPVFDAGNIQAGYVSARADYESAVAQYEQTLLSALHEVADALASQKALESRLKYTRAALEASEQAYDVVHKRYKSGLASYLQVLHVQESVSANRRAMAIMNTRAFMLDIALIKGVGGGYTQQTKTQE